MRSRSSEEEYGCAEGENESGGVEGLLHNLNIEMKGTEEEAAEDLGDTLGI